MSDFNFISDNRKGKSERERKPRNKSVADISFHVPEVATAEHRQPNKFFSTVGNLYSGIVKYLKNSKKPTQEKPASNQNPQAEKLETGGKTESQDNNIVHGDSVLPNKEHSVFTQPEKSDHDEHILGVNLMPWHDPNTLREKRIQTVVIGISVLIIAIWGVKLKVNLSTQKGEIKALQEEISELDANMSKLDTSKIEKSNRFAIARNEFVGLYGTLPRWSVFIDWLEKVTHPDVTYESISVDKSGNVSLVAYSNEYKSIAQQWIALENETDWLTNLRVGESFTSREIDGEDDNDSREVIGFSITFDLKMDALTRDGR